VEPSTARHVKEAHSANAVLPVTGAAARPNTAMLAARVLSAPATAQPAPFPPTASAVRTARHAREAHSATAVQPKATVARQTTATPVARVLLEPVTLALALSLPMEAVAKTERLVREAPTETAVLSTDTAARVMISAAPDASWPSDCAPASRLIQSVVPGTARLVLDLVLETVARRMDSVAALLLIVVRDGKFTFSMSSTSLLISLFSQKGASSACLTKDIPSLDSTCGSKVGLTCAGGPFNGQCCGSTGFCGSTGTHCGSGW
jgi:hypothetical protein